MLALNNVLDYFNEDTKQKYTNILNTLSNDTYYLSQKKELIQAILRFNVALLILDNEPEYKDLESHILYSDLLMTEFYKTMATLNEYSILRDVVMLTKQSITNKSVFYEKNQHLTLNEQVEMFFAPVVYLIEHGYLHNDIKIKIEAFLDNGEDNER